MTKEFIENQIKEIKELIEFSKDNMNSMAVREMQQDLIELQAMLKD